MGKLDVIHGEWWVDNRKRYPRPYVPPRHTAAGDLNDEGFTGWRLETLGPLLPGPLDPGSSIDGTSGPLSVWGTDRDGIRYSLLGARHWRTRHQSLNVRGGVQIWPVDVIVKSSDDWVEPADLVDQIDVYFRDLDAWAADPSTLVTEHDREAETVSISVETRSETAEVDEAEVEIRWGRDVSSSIEHVSASPGALIRIAHTVPIGDIADRWTRPLSRLMSLLMMRTSVVERIEARLARSSGTGRPEFVEVRFPQPLDDNEARHTESSIVKRQRQMLAIRKMLGSKGTTWDRLLPAYLDAINDDKFKTTLSLLIASQDKTEGFRFDDSLLYAFNGIESLHGRRFDGKVTEDPSIAAALRELKRQVPSGLKDAINPRLAAGRRKWMSEKIDELLEICGGIATALKAACPDLTSKLNDARTAAAHARTDRMTTQEQVDALVSAQWLLRHGLLQALRLDPQACDQIIQPHPDFKLHLKQLDRRRGEQTPTRSTT